MRTPTRFVLLSSLALLGVVACNDDRVAPTAPGAASRTVGAGAPGDLDAQIHALVASMFPVGHVTAVTKRWEAIARQSADERARTQGNPAATLATAQAPGSAHSMLVNLVDFIQRNTPEITPPAGETPAHAAARLVLDMSLYVYGGPAAQPPVLTPTSDAVVALVQPTTTDTVVTPASQAGVVFPAGAVSVPTIVVVALVSAPYQANCSGPLDTRLCQYPQFYTFNVFPDVKLLKPAAVSVCHVDAGTNRLPLADHDRFRVAHDRPADPANYTPDGTVVDGIEILPYVPLAITNCHGNGGTQYDPGQYGVRPAPRGGVVGPLLDGAEHAARRLAAAVGRALTPRDAYAIDGLGGGLTAFFSTFAVVDPQSAPDLQADTTYGGSMPAYVVPGGSLPAASWAVRNIGTATATGVSVDVVIASDSTLTTSATPLASLGTTAALAPRATLSGTAPSVLIPRTLPPGIYYVGVRASIADGGLADANDANNSGSARIEVRAEEFLPLGTLNVNQYIRSPSREYYLVMQADCNLVVYHSPADQRANPIWASGTVRQTTYFLWWIVYQPACRLVMQGDGNLVVYDSQQPIWSSVTWQYGPGEYHVSVRDDGHFAIYRGANPTVRGDVIWVN